MKVSEGKKLIKKRGGKTKIRTVKVKKGKYMKCAVTKKAGPKGGKTVCGPVRTTKK